MCALPFSLVVRRLEGDRISIVHDRLVVKFLNMVGTGLSGIEMPLKEVVAVLEGQVTK